MSLPQDWLQSIQEAHKLPAIQLSYFPAKEGRPNRWAEEHRMPEEKLLAHLKADLSKGITEIKSVGSKQAGGEKITIRGTHWKVKIEGTIGSKTGVSVCKIESVERLKHPSKALRIQPVLVDFQPIWEESPLDASEIREQFQAIKRKLKLAEHELTHPASDQSVQQLKEDHAKARKQYSALRVMMTLLRFKSEQDKATFEAQVAAHSDIPPTLLTQQEEQDCNVHLKIGGGLATDTLDSGVFVQIALDGDRRPLRTSVLAVHSITEGFFVELDLAAVSVGDARRVTLNTIPRFSMKANERAVTDFLRESVASYWQNLAHLVCSPSDIIPPDQSASIETFFCDQVPDAPRLNERQRQAVVSAVNAPSTFCIQGPPGTGKTTVICEIVQHLVARGERVLMVAPTHVAIDEVLRRIGGRPNVHPIRLSWDDSKVAPDVRQYLPSALSSPLFHAIDMSSGDKIAAWNNEAKSLKVALALLEQLIGAIQLADTSYDLHESAQREYEAFTRSYAPTQSELLEQREVAQADLKARRNDRAITGNHALEARRTLEKVRSNAGFGTSLLGIVGLGELGKAQHAYSASSKQLTALDEEVAALISDDEALNNKLDNLASTLADKRQAVSLSQENYQAHKSQRDKLQVKCETQTILTREELDQEHATDALNAMRERAKRLEIYPKLSATFRDILSGENDTGIDRDSLQRDLVNSANLFCCTTTGVAGSVELRDMEFDTLIVDEASRVTDSEFLIGAIRAKRWLLVGDENQLPPYVEQQDEHFIHALSALQQSESQGTALEDAVSDLGNLWHEDEELHKFRNDSVQRLAVELQSSGTWDELYKREYIEGTSWLGRRVKDPSKALLDAMREGIVHSLFERVVVNCPEGAKVRLSEQRRMIEPIARIVSKPVYGGDYQSPSVDDLAKCGVTPLTTATFTTPVTFLDTSSLGKKGREELIQNSFVNQAECSRIVEACLILDREITESPDKKTTVSILAFYKAQARLIERELRKHRFHRLDFPVIDAIDRIQGQESDVVFLSFTRTAGRRVSSLFGQWLQDIRRLNVACTRAHRALFLVGQREMLLKLHSNEQAIAFYKNLDSLFEQYPEDMKIIHRLGEQ